MGPYNLQSIHYSGPYSTARAQAGSHLLQNSLECRRHPQSAAQLHQSMWKLALIHYIRLNVQSHVEVYLRYLILELQSLGFWNIILMIDSSGLYKFTVPQMEKIIDGPIA